MIELELSRVKEIELLAKEKLNAIKLEENLYIIPANVAKSEVVALKEVNNSSKFEKIKDVVLNLEVDDSDCLTICYKNEKEDNNKVMEIINLGNSKTIDFEIVSELNHEDREELVEYIAYLHKNKNVLVTYYLPYDLEGLEQLL